MPISSRLALVVVLLFAWFQPGSAQQNAADIQIVHHTFYGADAVMPFYFRANQLGQVPYKVDNLFRTQIVSSGVWYTPDGRLGVSGGVRALNLAGDVNKSRYPEAYLNFITKYVVFGGGLYADSIQQSGLSVSNGNFLSGQNAAPFFRLKVGTHGYIPIGKGNFRFAALWEEGTMGKDNLVKNTLLHHKQLFLRWGTTERLEFTWGIDHYAQWSGHSPTAGELPSKPMDYIRTVFSLPGGPDANASDQENVQGNQLGQYYFIFRKSYPGKTFEGRIVHPFEDFSGMVFVNFPDNLYSMMMSLHDHPFLDKVILELTNTHHQSGADLDKKTGKYRHRNGRDNYFNHGTYGSFTHKGFMLGSPLFYPLKVDPEGTATSVANNRIVALHAGVMGHLFQRNLTWKLMATGSLNSGRYSGEYEPKRDQFHAMAEARYQFTKLPLWLSATVAADRGNLMTGHHQELNGVMVGVGWSWR